MFLHHNSQLLGASFNLICVDMFIHREDCSAEAMIHMHVAAGLGSV